MERDSLTHAVTYYKLYRLIKNPQDLTDEVEKSYRLT